MGKWPSLLHSFATITLSTHHLTVISTMMRWCRCSFCLRALSFSRCCCCRRWPINYYCFSQWWFFYLLSIGRLWQWESLQCKLYRSMQHGCYMVVCFCFILPCCCCCCSRPVSSFCSSRWWLFFQFHPSSTARWASKIHFDNGRLTMRLMVSIEHVLEGRRQVN